MAVTGKFAYMSHHFMLLRLIHFDLGVDKEGWWFECSCVIGEAFSSRGC